MPLQHRDHDCRTSTAALPAASCSEAGHVARTDTTEEQALVYGIFLSLSLGVFSGYSGFLPPSSVNGYDVKIKLK